MSRGKYSLVFDKRPDDYEYKYNCYGQIAEEWNSEIAATGVKFDDKTMFGDYDEDGYDKYGYSAFDVDGNFVGHGNGIDRAGYTEMDYLTRRDLGYHWEDEEY